MAVKLLVVTETLNGELRKPGLEAIGEARRLARLLVAEIKLYNEEEVEEGRREGDLYRRLRTDIERSRKMYEKRVHPAIKTQADYFESELVRVLAMDDSSLMGEEHSGAEVVNPISPDGSGWLTIFWSSERTRGPSSPRDS